jgi:hypothetical protein
MRDITGNLRLVLSLGLAAAIVLWASPLTFATTGGTQGLVIDVTPREGLSDGQQVNVTGSGFPPGQKVAIQQCPSPPGPNTQPPFTADDCDPDADASPGRSDYREAMVDSSGSFTTGFSAHRIIRAADGTGPIDCTKRPCAIVAFAADEATDDYAYDDISFR